MEKKKKKKKIESFGVRAVKKQVSLIKRKYASESEVPHCRFC